MQSGKHGVTNYKTSSFCPFFTTTFFCIKKFSLLYPFFFCLKKFSLLYLFLFKEVFITLLFFYLKKFSLLYLSEKTEDFRHPDQTKNFQAPVHIKIKFNKQLSTSVSQHLVSLKFDKWFENKICRLYSEFWKQKSCFYQIFRQLVIIWRGGDGTKTRISHLALLFVVLKCYYWEELSP